MAAGPITAAELIKINDENLSGAVASELLRRAPVLAALASTESSNAEYHSWQIRNVGNSANYRALNDGRLTTHAEDRIARVDLEYLDASHEHDVQAGRRYRFGTDALLDRETTDAMASSFQAMERQIIYGKQQQTNPDADGVVFGQTGGHEGLSDFWGEDTRTDKALYQPNVILVNTGATGAGSRTSVWAIRSADPDVDVASVFGVEGFEMLEPQLIRRIGNNGGSNVHGAWWTDIGGMTGFQFGQKRAAVRAANIDSSITTAGNEEVTDDLLANMISKFPAQMGPTMFAMSREAARQLRQSRTPITRSTTGAPPPFVEEAYGVPIIVTDQISNNEDEVTVT